MRNLLILASICSFLVSCATLESMLPKSETAAQPEQVTITQEGPVSPSLSSGAVEPAADLGDGSQAQAESQAAEVQSERSQVNNEERSTSELDSAAPEGHASDTFYASTEQKTETPTPELFPATLPEKQAAAPREEYARPDYSRSSVVGVEEKPQVKKSAKREIAKKHSKKHLAKKDKKHNKVAKKHGSKKSKAIAKKSNKKMDCKKIAKHSKKASKKEIAMCKAEKRKMASTKTKRVSKVSSRTNRI